MTLFAAVYRHWLGHIVELWHDPNTLSPQSNFERRIIAAIARSYSVYGASRTRDAPARLLKLGTHLRFGGPNTLFAAPFQSSQSLLPSANSYRGYGAQWVWRHAMTVFACVNTSKQAGDAEHIKVFANYLAGFSRVPLLISEIS